MTPDLVVPTWQALVTLLLVLAVTVALAFVARSLAVARERTEALLAAAASDAEGLHHELAGLEQRLGEATAAANHAGERVPVARVDDREYLITDLGEERGPRVPAPVVPAPVFADIVLRESVIKTAALAAGLRRALSPEIRHRIRFEMRREVKRARKERRLMLKAARRDWESRQRSSIDPASERVEAAS